MGAVEKKYSFVVQSLPDTTFEVVRFEGSEGLSFLYSFDILLASQENKLDFTSVLGEPCTLSMRAQDAKTWPVHGVVATIEQLERVGQWTFYRVILRPRLWEFTRVSGCRVFLNKVVPAFMEDVLKAGNLNKARDYEFRIQQNYTPFPYVCQYNETPFNFLSRWLERDGMYYFFDQSKGVDKLVIVDDSMAHKSMPQGGTLHFAPASGLDKGQEETAVRSFVHTRKSKPKNVRLKDYNYQTPALDLMGEALVNPQGQGEFFMYAGNLRHEDEVKLMAKICAQGFKCRENVYRGTGALPFMRGGYTFKLDKHPVREFNREYLVLRVTHKGGQERYLRTNMGVPVAGESEGFYQNSFICLAGNVQYRPKHLTPWPRISGVMHARVDAEGSGKYAELDEHGRYKVELPFDLSGHAHGKKSAWIRKLQPYGGKDHGMHFPLHKGTDVLLSFIDGDPDRPVIVGAAPNPEHPSPVTAQDQSMAKITTAGQNKIHIEDREDSKRILLHSPTAESFIRIGEPNDPVHWSPGTDFVGIKLHTLKGLNISVATLNTVILPTVLTLKGSNSGVLLPSEKTSTIIGEEHTTIVGAQEEVVLGGNWNLVLGFSHEFLPTCFVVNQIRNVFRKNKNEVVSEEVRLAEEHIKAAEEAVEAVDEKTKLLKRATKFINKQTTACESKISATKKKMQALEKQTKVMEERIDVAQEKTSMAELDTELVADWIGMADTDTIAAENMARESMNRVSLASDAADVAETYTETCSEKTALYIENGTM